MIGSERTTCIPATSTDDRTARIRRLNDALRCYAHSGVICITAGVQALGEEGVEAVLLAVRDFNDFTNGNDPHAEHDFGALRAHGARILWKKYRTRSGRRSRALSAPRGFRPEPAIMTGSGATARLILPIRPSPAGCSPLCFPRSIDGAGHDPGGAVPAN